MSVLKRHNLTEDYAEVLKESETVLTQCFKEHKMDEVFVSFNGGKDCTVLLDITLKFLSNSLRLGEKEIGRRLKIFYIRTDSPFEELEEFVRHVEQHYGLTMVVEEGDLKNTLRRILDRDRDLKVCLLGTRRSDPYCQDMKFTQKTDSNWPEILRVSPLLNWSYHQIWTYIMEKDVPYCSLYNAGYTSIGSTQNTEPNPALIVNNDGNITYLPAWRLSDATLERAGRTSKSKPINKYSINPHVTNTCHPRNGLGDSQNGDLQNGDDKISSEKKNSNVGNIIVNKV